MSKITVDLVKLIEQVMPQDESELHIHVLAPAGNREDRASDAYYGLLVAISNI